MKALLLDYNGVIVDDEPLHYESFRQVLADDGITLTPGEYESTYLGLDDRAAFRKAMTHYGLLLDDAAFQQRVTLKSVRYLERATSGLAVVPGVTEFVRAVAESARIAVVSGALAEEIPLGLERAGIRDLVEVLVSSGDVKTTKPHPGGFQLALRRLSDLHGQTDWEAVVVEDSLPGIGAAHALGAGCIAITTSHPAGALHEADLVWRSFEGHHPMELERLWRPVRA